MKKTPTIYKRNPDNMSELLDEVNPVCQWVFDGEGRATRKYDGTCCLVMDGVIYKRRELKKDQEAPFGFIEADHDILTGKIVGWLAVSTHTSQDRWFREAPAPKSNGTYELLGPKVQGNPEKFQGHVLLKHSDAHVFPSFPKTMRNFDGFKMFLEHMDIEGIVFHHPDGRMAKIKKKDFGFKRN